MRSDFTQLLLDVQKKANITIRLVRDVRFLKEEIESSTERVIGFNTLRRLFGFLENRTPSVTTLNTLSIYLGFSSFANYQANHSTYEQWYFQQNLQRLILTGRVGNKEVEFINKGLVNTPNTVYFAHFITHFVEQNNHEVLKKIFSEVNFSSISDTEIHKFALLVSVKLNSLSQEKAVAVCEKLIPISNFRNNVPLLYIDYSNLMTRYGKVLDLIKKNGASESDVLFVDLMKGFSLFYSEKIEEMPLIGKPEAFNSFYSVLQGRYFGYQILCADALGIEVKNDIEAYCSISKVSFFLEEIVPALLIKEEYEFLNHLFSQYYEDIFELEVWSSKTTQAIYLIGLAAVNLFKGSTTIARKNLELVELNRVELGYEKYVALFYLLISIQVNYLATQTDQISEEYDQLKVLVKETGFTLFLTVTNNILKN